MSLFKALSNPRQYKRQRKGQSAYSIAASYGFPYVVTVDYPYISKEIVYSRFSEYADRRRPYLLVGYDHKKRDWRIIFPHV
jgi:hypothetical protein